MKQAWCVKFCDRCEFLTKYMMQYFMYTRDFSIILLFKTHAVGLWNFKRCKLNNSKLASLFMLIRRSKNLIKRPGVDVGDIIEHFCCKLFTRKLLRLKFIHQSLPTAWGLIIPSLKKTLKYKIQIIEAKLRFKTSKFANFDFFCKIF